MASINFATLNISKPQVDPSTPWTKDQATREAVNTLMVKKFTQIVAEYHEKKTQGGKGGLERGIWYANDYADALEKHAQPKRLEWLQTHNCFYHGYPPKGFTQLTNPATLTGLDWSSYAIKSGSVASEALQDVVAGRFSFTDCGSAVEIARYQTLETILGKERFDQIFSPEGKNPLKLHPHMLKTPLYDCGFVKEVRAPAASHQLGDNAYVSSVPLYRTKHPNGEGMGYHMVCVNDSPDQEKTYCAFGLPPHGHTVTQMYDVLVEAFNSQPIKPSQRFSQKLTTKLEEESSQARTQFFWMAHAAIDDYVIDRSTFDEAVQQASQDKVGLYPIVTRFSIAKIREHLQ